MTLRLFRSDAGVTLIELVVTLTILSVLAMGIMPLSVISTKRAKEFELKRNLRTIRTALDAYKERVDDGEIPKEAFSSGYPKTLEILVEGVEIQGPVPYKVKFLRRLPQDPMTEDGEWGLRSYADASDSNSWGGQDVYDVYSKSGKKALDGTHYKDW
jgi:general secretion pathway protein G